MKGGAFVPLVLNCQLPAGVTLENARIEFDYNANDPSTLANNPMSIADATANYGEDMACNNNPLSGRIRIWTKDAWQHRNANSVTNSGDFVTANVPLSYSSVVPGSANQVTLYVEGIGTSDYWGLDKIHVKVYPDSSPNVLADDEVSYTVVRCVYKVCAYRPYACVRDSNLTVLSRNVYKTDYTTPFDRIGCIRRFISQTCRFHGSWFRTNRIARPGPLGKQPIELLDRTNRARYALV